MGFSASVGLCLLPAYWVLLKVRKLRDLCVVISEVRCFPLRVFRVFSVAWLGDELGNIIFSGCCRFLEVIRNSGAGQRDAEFPTGSGISLSGP